MVFQHFRRVLQLVAHNFIFMKVSLALVILLSMGVNCTTQKAVPLATKNTLRCEAYRFDRAQGKSDKIYLRVKSYWCDDNEVVKKGIIFVKDHNNKVVALSNIDSIGVAFFELQRGFYTIGTQLGPVKTPLVLIEPGTYELTFHVGPDEIILD